MSELVAIEKESIPSVFVENGLDPVIEKIKAEVSGFVPDVTTAKGRKDIGSLAHKVARSKTYLDGLGKDLVSSIKIQTKAIDSERKRMRDELDALKDEVRAPLTEWENIEKERVAALSARVESIKAVTVPEEPYSSSLDVAEIIVKIETLEIDDSFEEFKAQATEAKLNAILWLKGKKLDLVEAEEKAAEEERIRLENEERDRQEREAEIARKAAEKARSEEAAKAKAAQEEADRKEREAKAAIERAEQEAKAAEDRRIREAEDAKKRAEDAEKARVAAEEKAKRDAEEAAERARIAEIQRQEEEARKTKEEQEKREANKRHIGKIRKQAKEGLISQGLSEETAKKIVLAIHDGLIPNVKISY